MIIILFDPETRRFKTVGECKRTQAERVIAQLKNAHLLQPVPGQRLGPGRRGTPVTVVAVCENTLGRYVRQGGAESIQVGEEFANAPEASLALGCNHNDVGTQLAYARRHGRTRATVRGVTFEWGEDLPD